MKRLLILICVFLNFSITAHSSELRIIIDERIELTSIAFRLAGAQEYVTDCAPTYLKEVDEYFFKYKSHQLVKYIKELRVKFSHSHPMINAFGKRKLNGYENVVFQGVQHSPDNRTIIIPLLKPLEKGKTYGFAIPAAMLVSADTYHRVKEDCQFIFKTEE